MISVRNNIATKLKNIECGEAFANDLETELISDFEGFVQEKLAAFRDTLANTSEEIDYHSDNYENQEYVAEYNIIKSHQY